MEKYENNTVNANEGQDEMESQEQFEKSISQEELEEIVEEIRQTYKEAVSKVLEDGDPLKQKILDYFVNRDEAKDEYTYILSNLPDSEKKEYVSNLKDSLKDSSTFINKMERYFTTQDIYKSQRDLKVEPRIATAQEYEIGAYSEFIEPQMRDSVFLANGKGYKTFQSGFNEKDPKNQFIDVYNANVEIPENLKKVLSSFGVAVQVENLDDRTTVTLSPIDTSKTIRQEEWKKIWDEFAKGLPDADPKLVDNAEEPILHGDFRKVQDLMKKIKELR